MISLGDLLGAITPTAPSTASAPTAATPQDREAYLAYSEAVMTRGGSPLSYPEWIKAGRPSK